MDNQLSWEDFSKVDMRIGTIVEAYEFKEARNPAYILHIDFGKLGVKKSSAQITKLYKPEDLIGQQVVAVVNFPPKQIANILSECLVLGAVDKDEVILLSTERVAENGLKIG